MSTYLSSIQLFPALLSARRRSLHLSAADLAAQAGMTVDMIARLEHGLFLPSPSQATQLAVILGLDPVDLGGTAAAPGVSCRAPFPGKRLGKPQEV
jgi:transcriptional regulator with XRE-family HTH domain